LCRCSLVPVAEVLYSPPLNRVCAGNLAAPMDRGNVVGIKRLVIGRVLFRRLRIGLLVPGLTSVLVLAGTGPANAAVTVKGNGLTVTIVGAHLGVKQALSVHFSVSCGTANDEKDEVAEDADTSPDTYALILSFTLSENVNGTVVSHPGGYQGGNSAPPITCDRMPHPFTFTLHPQTGATWYTPGPAQLSNIATSALDSDRSCGYVPYNGQTVPKPCDGIYPPFSKGISINS